MGIEHSHAPFEQRRSLTGMVSQPQFLLFCDAQASDAVSPTTEPTRTRNVFGRWHFVLERLDGDEQLEAADSESSIHPDRLALLSVVRGLEALEQPSRVNLVTTSRYVSRGLRYGLSTWRESDYQWERFGVQKPIRNADLWQRVDQALKYHGVTCRLIQSTLAASQPSPAPILNRVRASGSEWDATAVARTRTTVIPTVAARKVTDLPTLTDWPASHRPRSTWESRLTWQIQLWDWWELAISWMRWWRGRLHRPPALFGAS
ncbi:MAG: RNase H family protein [Pirellulaceae bacterium]